MNESQQYTPSELIYLFLDGEADGIQQSTLFAALAHDADLQGEFQEAVLVGKTLDRVRNDVHPPQDFTEGVFAAAGFTAPQFRPIPVPLAGKWSASLSAIIRQTGIPIVSAMIGALTVFLLMTLGRDGGLPASVRTVAENQTTLPGISHGSGAFTSTNDVPNGIHSSPLPSEDIHATGTVLERGDITESRVPPDATPRIQSRVDASSSVFAKDIPSAQTVENNPMSIADVPEEARIESEPVQAIAKATVPVVEQALLKSPMRTLEHQHSYADLQPIYRWENTASEKEPGVSLFVRGIESINSFPSRTNNIEASGSTSNVGFGCLYHYSHNQALGMEFARELLPIYNAGGDDPELNSVLVWIGGLWQIQTDFPGLRSDIQPFMRLGLGGTAYGPSGKALFGIMYTAEQRLSISLGVETTALLSWQNGKIGSTEKIAFSYGLSFHF